MDEHGNGSPVEAPAVRVERLTDVEVVCPECFESITINDVRQFVLTLHQQKSCEPLGKVLGI
jgi:hypothetical protein